MIMTKRPHHSKPLKKQILTGVSTAIGIFGAVIGLSILAALGKAALPLLLIGGASFYGYRYYSHRQAALKTQQETEQLQQAERQKNIEKTIIRLAQQFQGRLTATELAAHSELSIAEATAWLNALVEKKFAAVHTTDRGVTIYIFHFANAPAPDPAPNTQTTSKTQPEIIHCILTGKSIPNTPEERIRQKVLQQLLQNYGYQRSELETEYPIQMGSKRKRADIAIFPPLTPHQQGTIHSIIEVKAPPLNQDQFKAALLQLQSYVAAALNCHYAMLAHDKWHSFEVVTLNNQKALHARPDFPKSQSL